MLPAIGSTKIAASSCRRSERFARRPTRDRCSARRSRRAARSRGSRCARRRFRRRLRHRTGPDRSARDTSPANLRMRERAGECARDADRAHHRLRSGRHETQALHRRQVARESARRAEPPRHASSPRRIRPRPARRAPSTSAGWRVPEEQRSVGHDVVDVAASRLIVGVRPPRAGLDEHRPADAPRRAHRRVATAGQHGARTLDLHTLARFAGSTEKPCPKCRARLPLRRRSTSSSRAFPSPRTCMRAFGLGCSGCSVSKYETIEQGARAHGLAGRTDSRGAGARRRDGQRAADRGRRPATPAARARRVREARRDRAHDPRHVGKRRRGQSLVTALLAIGLRRKHYRVGILDADITGPVDPEALRLDVNR